MYVTGFLKKISEFKTTLYISLTTSSANALKQFNLHVYIRDGSGTRNYPGFFFIFFSIFGHFLMIFSNVEFEPNGAINWGGKMKKILFNLSFKKIFGSGFRFLLTLPLNFSTSKRWDKKIFKNICLLWTGILFSWRIFKTYLSYEKKLIFFLSIGKSFSMTIHSWIGKCQERVINLFGREPHSLLNIFPAETF